jgi:CHASE3 domain sensor protein
MMTFNRTADNLTEQGKQDLIGSYLEDLSENMQLIEIAISCANDLDNSNPEAHRNISRIKTLLTAFIAVTDATLDNLDNYLNP